MIRKYVLIGFTFIFLFGISLANTSGVGCCFDASTGFCSINADENTCIGDGGDYYADASCSSVSECSSGCCVLGPSTKWTTERTCQLESDSSGFDIDYRNIDQASCDALGSSLDEGACVFEGQFDNTCSYITRGECSISGGVFYLDQLCSDPSLDTICTRTDQTACFDDDVRYLDSCGNRDSILMSCDYNSGEICGSYRSGIDPRPSVGDYTCRNLNCANGRANGERWCVNENPHFVGSRDFAQYCLNGEIYTEPCDDFRFGTCNAGSCELNPWGICLSQNGDIDPLTGERDVGACAETDGCHVWAPESACVDVVQRDGSFSRTIQDCSEEAVEGALALDPEAEVESNKLLDDLKLDLCVPDVAAGLQFYPPQSGGVVADTPAAETCAAGNFETVINFDHDKGDCDNWRINDENGGTSANTQLGEWGHAGIFYSEMSGWQSDHCSGYGVEPLSGNPIDSIFPSGHNADGNTAAKINQLYGLIDEGLFPDPLVLELLTARCKNIGDCNGKKNWEGTAGAAEAEFFLSCSSSRSDAVTCTFKFECVPFKAPAGDSACESCGGDGFPCSEYRCKALGQACDYFDPDGADNGFCVSADDSSAPTISCVNCPSEVEPSQEIELEISTSETAECRFDIGDSGGTYGEMPYSFGGGYNTTHITTLYVPGQTPDGFEGSTYGLISEDGEYDVFVRCSDVAGNWNVAAHKITFNVLPVPDTFETQILSFDPVDGSAVASGLTEKEIEFEINEPSECKWDIEDTDYDSMDNAFVCDTAVSDDGIINGYSCSGILTGITNETGEETDYYIRCKDQPWLEGQEADPYFRNTNSQSNVYSLRPSTPLLISSLAPEGEQLLSAFDTGVTLEITTEGGGYNGEAVCQWSLDGSAFINFTTTGGTKHSHPVSNQTEGTHVLEVMCEDKAENIVEAGGEFSIKIDRDNSRLSRIYAESGKLVVVTNEPGECYVSYDSCSFDTAGEHAILMSESGLKHTTNLNGEVIHYIKCKDDRGNDFPSLCNAMVRGNAVY